MIRIIDKHTSQILHRRSPHTKMLECIDYFNTRDKETLKVLLDLILEEEDHTLEDLVSYVPKGVPNTKLFMLLLIHLEYSYYKGRYRKRKDAVSDASLVLERLNSSIAIYLEALESR